MIEALTPQRIRAVAVAAMVAPETVRRYLDGKTVRASLRERIENALREMGIMQAVASNGQTARKE